MSKGRNDSVCPKASKEESPPGGAPVTISFSLLATTTPNVCAQPATGKDLPCDQSCRVNCVSSGVGWRPACALGVGNLIQELSTKWWRLGMEAEVGDPHCIAASSRSFLLAHGLQISAPLLPLSPHLGYLLPNFSKLEQLCNKLSPCQMPQ